MYRAEDAVPRCGFGHPVAKLKKLKLWQTSAGRKCSVCEVSINRSEYRWRYAFHCPWDMCHHCYEKHWDSIIQDATREKDRQRSLEMLATVPAERRKRKDFMAAFGDSRDARLLLPPEAPISAGYSSASDGSETEGDTVKVGSPELRCSHGHLIRKLKKLKPWQSVTKSIHSCAECGDGIGKDEFRWRCDQHCNWDMCQDCYELHWSHVVQEVIRSRDEQRCWQLLGAVPLDQRDRPDFLAAQARVHRRAGKVSARTIAKKEAAVSAATISAAGTEAGPKDMKGKIQGAAYILNDGMNKSPLIEIALWSLLCVAASTVPAAIQNDLEGHASDGRLQFPDPFLMMGLSGLLGASLLQFALRFVTPVRTASLPPAPIRTLSFDDDERGRSEERGESSSRGGSRSRSRSKSSGGRRRRKRDPAEDYVEPDWKVFGILGVMCGVETGLTAIFRELFPEAAERELLALTPPSMLMAGLLAGSQQSEPRMSLAIGLASLGGFLAPLGSPEVEFWPLVLAVLIRLLSMMRWVFTNNILPPMTLTPSHRCSAMLKLAANMAVPGGVVCLELATLTHVHCYLELSQLPGKGMVLLKLLWMGICQVVVLVSQLQLARLASLPMIGLLQPLGSVVLLVSTFCSAGLQQALPTVVPSWANWAGVLFCGASACSYYKATVARSDVQDQTAYGRLAGGEFASNGSCAEESEYEDA